MKELQINPSGLLGLVLKIDEELRNGKSQDEILSDYPISKTSLPHLLTLARETSILVLDLTKDLTEEYGEIESKYMSLKKQMEGLQAKKDVSNTSDTQNLLNQIQALKNENYQLREELNSLKDENNQLQKELSEYQKELEDYILFFNSNSFCSMFFRNFLRKMQR